MTGARLAVREIISHLRANPGDYTLAGLAGYFGCSVSTVYTALCRLRDDGEVVMNGKRHNVTWTVRDTAPPVDFEWDLLPPAEEWVSNFDGA